VKDAKGHGSNAHSDGVEKIPGTAYAVHRDHNIQLTAINEAHARVLAHCPKGPMGLTPDHVRATPEYKTAKANFDRSFAALRDHNAFMTKNFKKEMKADRDARRQARLKK